VRGGFRGIVVFNSVERRRILVATLVPVGRIEHLGHGFPRLKSFAPNEDVFGVGMVSKLTSQFRRSKWAVLAIRIVNKPLDRHLTPQPTALRIHHGNGWRPAVEIASARHLEYFRSKATSTKVPPKKIIRGRGDRVGRAHAGTSCKQAL
jgi:hypothetical protein